MNLKQGFLHAARKLATALALCIFVGGVSTAAHAGTVCSIGVDNASVLLHASFSDIGEYGLPSSVSQTANFTATCSTTDILSLSSYRWVLSAQDLQVSVVSGSTSSSVLQNLTKTFSLSKTTLSVANGLLGGTASDSASATFQLSGITSKLGVGSYAFTQHIVVQRQSCLWALFGFICANDGGPQTFSAVFTLNVVAPVTQPTPPASSGSSGSSSSSSSDSAWPAVTGVSPNPWTVHRYAARTRYHQCYWSVSCRGWSTR